MSKPPRDKKRFSVQALFPHSVITGDIIVRVSVSFLPEKSAPANGRWQWAYHIRIENGGAQEVQLLSREWTIADGRGGRDQVQGEGVVGQQPIIRPGEAFDYVSGCPLRTPTGWMEGHYHMIGADGRIFTVAIPRFPLVAPPNG